MMFRLLCLLVLFVSLNGCGGGGSGNSASREGLRILHGAIDFPPLQVLSSLNEQSLGFEPFLGSGQRMRISPEAQELSFFARGKLDDLFTTVSLADFEGGNVSYLIYGDYNSYGFRIARLSESLPEFDSSQALLRVAHAVLGAARIRVEFLSGASVAANFGAASDFAAIEPGVHTLVIRREIDGREIARATLELLAGTTVTILVAGEVDVFVQSRIYID